MKVTLLRNLRRKRRISANLKGTEIKPRLCVFRSNRYIYLQAIDDVSRKTIVSYSSLELARKKDRVKKKKTDEAKDVGVEFGKKLLKKGIKMAVFDRSMYAYKGRVKLLAEAVRAAGIIV